MTSPAMHALLRMVAAGPDPEGAQPLLERYFEAGGRAPTSDEGQRLLVALLAQGSYLADLLLRAPSELDRLERDPWLHVAKPAGDFAEEAAAACATATDEASLHRCLRGYARREMLRLGAREIGWGTTLQVARELSGLADACLDVAVRFLDAVQSRRVGAPTSPERPPGFVVLGMGKLGGEELNFSSDVDLVYVYATDEGSAGAMGLHEYYTRLGQQLTAAIDATTEDGRIFRVDLRLRPEGRAGALCNSLPACERYYETFGRTWERQALLRARPCAGDRALGAELLATLEPFVFPRSLHPSTIDELKGLRRLYQGPADARLERRPQDGHAPHARQARPDTTLPGFDVKLGSGGIRDVELVAQVLQLLNAGRRRELRERTTLPALTKLALAGLLTDEEARTLATAYQFLRRIEHRLQLQDGAQTQSLPTQPAALEVLARRLGFPAAEAFLDELDRTRTAVSAIAATLGEPTAGPSALVLRLLDPAAAPERLDADLAQAGFHDRRAGAEALALAGGRMPPSWLTETLASPDPDRALGRFRDLALRGSHGLFRWLEAERPLLRMLAALFGTSERLGGLLLGNPALWEPLLLGLGAPRPEVGSWKERLATRLAALDEEEALREARRFQAEEILRTGLHDAAGTLAVHEVSAQLTLLAEACLATAIDRVTDTLARRYGAPEAELVVLGMGSLGARELRYGSDLDLVFLFSREGTTTRGMDHAEWFARLAQRLISALGALLDEGRLYEVDTRLRPSGAQGMLVTTTASFDRYHHDDAAPWERAALVRSRVVYARRLGETAKIAATTAEADGAFPARLEAITYERPFDRATLRRELLHMRHRMEAERAGAGAVNLRLGAGGLADLELIAAVGQLEGAGDRRLRTTETLVALERLAVAGWSPPELVGDCRFLLAAISKLRLLRERPDDRVLAPDRAALARALGLDEADLVAQITTRMRRARHELCRLVGEPRPRP